MSHTASGAAPITALTVTAGTSFLVVHHHAVHVPGRELFATPQEGELDEKGAAHHLRPSPLHQAAEGAGGAAGGEEVVVDEYARTAGQRVAVHLQGVDPVLERVLD